MKKQAGFTLIELIVVILILGILAATALPKFVNVEKEAHAGAHAGASGAFQAAIMLVHSKWLAAGKPAAGDMDIDTGAGVYVGATGWAEDGDAGVADSAAALAASGQCADLWNELFQQNGPVAAAAAGAGVDYVATYAAGAPRTCTYEQQGIGIANELTLIYNADDGSIVVDKNPNDG